MTLPQDKKQYLFEAFYVAKSIAIAKASEKLEKNLVGKRREFLTYLLGPNEYVFVFSFGAIVFINIPKSTQVLMRKSLGKFLENPVKKQYEESYVLEEREGVLVVKNDRAELPTIRIEEIEMSARVLAQSVALERIEDVVEEMISGTAIVQTKINRFGAYLRNTRLVLKLVSQNNEVMHFIISKLSLLDKPDITWERKELEAFFSQLADIFELRSRFRNIEYK